MKNLPDDELFNSLESRLRNFSAVPDDAVWDKIAEELSPSREPGWMIWSDRIAAVSLLTLLFMVAAFKNEGVKLSEDMKSSGVLVPKKQSETMEKKDDDSTLTYDPHQNVVPGARLDAQRSVRTHGNEHRNGNFVRIATDESPAILRSANNGEEEVAQSIFLANVKPETGRTVPMDQNGVSIDSSLLANPVVDSAVVEQQRVVSPIKRRKKSKMTLYTSLTPSVSFQHVSPFADDEVIFQGLNSPGVFSTDRLGVGFEAGIQGGITARLQYMAGLNLYYQSQRLKYTLVSQHEVVLEEDGDNSYTINPAVTEHSFRYDMLNIGAQAGLLYTIKQTGLIHKAGVVLHYQKGLQQTSVDDEYDNSGSHYLGYQLIYRVEYPIHQNLHFFLQPNYSRTFLTHEALDAPFKMKQSRAGISVGLVFRF